jgi:heat shock protein HspQ
VATKKQAPDTGYTPSEAQLDLERRQGNDNESSLRIGQTVQPHESPFTGNGFVNVDPVYQNFANEVDEPLLADSGATRVAEDQFDPSVPVEADEPEEASSKSAKS